MYANWTKISALSEFWLWQSGKTTKNGIPQLRYIYRNCGIYSVFLFFCLYFRFSMSSRGWFSCLACFHSWNIYRTKSDVFRSHQSLLPVLILENINSALLISNFTDEEESNCKFLGVKILKWFHALYIYIYTGVLIFAGTNFAIFAKLLIGLKQRIALQTFQGNVICEN